MLVDLQTSHTNLNANLFCTIRSGNFCRFTTILQLVAEMRKRAKHSVVARHQTSEEEDDDDDDTVLDRLRISAASCKMVVNAAVRSGTEACARAAVSIACRKSSVRQVCLSGLEWLFRLRTSCKAATLAFSSAESDTDSQSS